MLRHISWPLIIATLQYNPIFATITLYETPSEQANIIEELGPDNQLTIHQPEWTKITDKSTGKSGWVKIADLNKNSHRWTVQYHYQYGNNNETEQPTQEKTASHSRQAMGYWQDQTRRFHRLMQAMNEIHSSFFDHAFLGLDDEHDDAHSSGRI